MYEGNFKTGKRHGKGHRINKDGSQYTGDYSDDKPNGRGNLIDNSQELTFGKMERSMMVIGKMDASMAMARKPFQIKPFSMANGKKANHAVLVNVYIPMEPSIKASGSTVSQMVMALRSYLMEQGTQGHG